MNKELMEVLINEAVDTGSNYCDIFYENTFTKKIVLSDNKIDKIDTEMINGVGIRLVFDETVYHTSTNDITKDNLLKVTREIAKNGNGKRILENIKLDKEITKKLTSEKPNNKVLDEYKKEYLYNINKIARNYDPKIVQVEASFFDVI